MYNGSKPSGLLRIAVIGGNEEIGRNMTMIEYGEDILLIDMGIQFAEYDQFGIDGLVPDLSYLKGKEHRVRGVIITHMHMDHIGAIPFLMPMLPNVPLFSAKLTLSLIAKKLAYTPEVKVNMQEVGEDSVLKLGGLTVRFLGVSHSVPAALGVIIETPAGPIVHTGDFNVDLHPQTDEAKHNMRSLIELGQRGVLALMSDSTNASMPGHQILEREVISDFEKIFADAKGRILFGMISSNVERLNQLIKTAEKYGRHVFIGGLSLNTTFEIANQLGYIKPKHGTIVDGKRAKHLPDHKLIAIFPGAQGESNGSFYKLADGKHRDLDVKSGDTVVFSSSVIPGNERSVQTITDKFFRRGAIVINYKMLDIHAGGHAKREDLKEVVRLVKPKYLIPIEGQHAFLHNHADAAKETGFPAERIFIADNGQIMEFDGHGSGRLTEERLPLQRVFVRGREIRHIDENTLLERRSIAEEGVLSVTCVQHPGLKPSLRVHSYGMRKPEQAADLHRHVAQTVERLLTDNSKKDLKQKLERYLEDRFHAKPHLVIELVEA